MEHIPMSQWQYPTRYRGLVLVGFFFPLMRYQKAFPHLIFLEKADLSRVRK